MKILFSSIYLKPVIILLVFAHFFSCSSWKKINQPIEEFIETKPEHILVEKNDESKIELYYAFIKNDSLRGIIYTPKFIHGKFALNEIQSIYIKALNTTHTIYLIIGVGLIIGLLVAAIVISSMDFGFGSFGPNY